ncbi:MAG TPA: DUF29 domain-containing protein, partial [Acetobacteraceae bacterium]|nr:DUF29 domain-containing protein [Acetobacteraceae bacterium]
MPDDRYDRDVLAWSQHQAALLRRLAHGERVTVVDWEHVVEEIEDAGLSQFNLVQSYRRLMLVHLLKVHAWPHSVAAGHWPGEILSFQADVAQRYLPSMRQRIDLARLYGLALRQVAKIADGDGDPVRTPDTCPF